MTEETSSLLNKINTELQHHLKPYIGSYESLEMIKDAIQKCLASHTPDFEIRNMTTEGDKIHFDVYFHNVEVKPFKD